jgi:hypothetical protein
VRSADIERTAIEIMDQAIKHFDRLEVTKCECYPDKRCGQCKTLPLFLLIRDADAGFTEKCLPFLTNV